MLDLDDDPSDNAEEAFDYSSTSRPSSQSHRNNAPRSKFPSDNQNMKSSTVDRDPAPQFNVNSKGALYDAYNQLNVLAQGYAKPFDAPAVVVVGHQSSVKSSLMEALMGFQFNQIGGGTKKRRPVALRMQYNPKCHQPKCYLISDEDGIERPMTLSDIQDYIDRENRRLERDPVRSFDSKEIHVRMEYKYCPNMILIDTPGLIAAPRVGRNGGAGAAVAQQRALQAAAKEAERLVVEKMRCEDYIILCVEDTSDWKHGHTREIVQKADPDLSRTVIVKYQARRENTTIWNTVGCRRLTTMRISLVQSQTLDGKTRRRRPSFCRKKVR